jgi:OTU-like cysteine protease
MADDSCQSWCVKQRRAKNLTGRSWNYVGFTEGRLKLTVCKRTLCPAVDPLDLHHPTAGNCLFRALSDQLYNTTERHDNIRQTVVGYLRTNRAHFEPFVLANVEENLIRSQPTTRSSRSRKFGIDQDPFETYLENMAKPNTWGGEIEITAFCEVFDRDVLIHRPTDAECPFNQMVNSKRAAGQPKVFLHISFGVSTPEGR